MAVGTPFGSALTSVATSPDGITWTQRTMPVSAAWAGVRFGNGLFVAFIANSSTIATSPDGIAWTQRTLPVSAAWVDLAYGAGTFVMIATGTTTYVTSSDGITWTQRALPSVPSGSWAHIDYVINDIVGAGRFLIVGTSYAAGLIFSTTGTGSWTGQSFPVVSGLTSSSVVGKMAAGNGNFLIVFDATSVALRLERSLSYNEFQFTTVALPDSGTWVALGYGNGVFVLLRSGLVGFQDAPVLFGYGGVTWTTAANDYGFAARDIAYGAGTFVAVTAANNVFAGSQSSLISPFTVDITDIALRAVPVKSVAGKTGVITLTPADVSGGAAIPTYATWTQGTLPASAAWRAVAYGNGVFVAIAASSTTAATSADGGTTWTQRTLPANTSWSALTFGNGLFVAVATSSAIAATSPDGITWTQRALPTSSTWTSVIFGNDTFVAVSQSGGVGATSPDGIAWTQRSLSSGIWASVTYGKGLFVTVAGRPGLYGSSAAARTSPDGITWTARTLPQVAIWSSVTFGNGVFVAVALAGQNETNNTTVAATSPDGITWTSRTLPASATWSSVTFGNGLFVAVSGLGTTTNIAATSPDGITWTQRTLPASLQWRSVTYGVGAVVAVPSDSAVSGVAFENLLSTLAVVPGVGGPGAGTVCAGDDARLSDARKPLAPASFLVHGNSGSAKTLSGTAAIQTCTLSASCTFTMPSAATIASFTLILKQNATFTATFTGVKWPASATPTITTGTNKVDVIRFVSDGTSWYGQIAQNYT